MLFKLNYLFLEAYTAYTEFLNLNVVLVIATFSKKSFADMQATPVYTGRSTIRILEGRKVSIIVITRYFAFEKI